MSQLTVTHPSAMRQTGAPNFLQKWKDKYVEVGFTPDQWQAFLLQFSGDVDAILQSAIEQAVSGIAGWKGPRKGEVTPPADAPAQPESLLHPNAELEKQTLTPLSAEVARLRGLIGIDAEENTKIQPVVGKKYRKRKSQSPSWIVTSKRRSKPIDA